MTSQELDKPEIALRLIENEKALQAMNLDEASVAFTKRRVPRMFPIFVVFYKGKFAGYFQVIQQAIIYPEVHPHLLEGLHQYVDLVSALATETQRNCGNPIFMLCDKVNSLGEKVLKSMRLKRSEETAYLYDGD